MRSFVNNGVTPQPGALDAYEEMLMDSDLVPDNPHGSERAKMKCRECGVLAEPGGGAAAPNPRPDRNPTILVSGG